MFESNLMFLECKVAVFDIEKLMAEIKIQGYPSFKIDLKLVHSEREIYGLSP